MQGRRDHWSKAGAATVALALLVVGAVVAQDPARPEAKGVAPGKEANAKEKDKGKAPARKGRLLRAPGREPGKAAREYQVFVPAQELVEGGVFGKVAEAAAR